MNQSKSRSRESSIELLRILAIEGVIILHYNHIQIGGGFQYVVKGSWNQWILYFFESSFVCAVDLFILISGYFLCTVQKRKLIKPMKLIIQVMIFLEQ